MTTDSFSADRANSGPPAPGTVTVTLPVHAYTGIGYASDSDMIGKGPNGLPNGSKSQGFQVQEFIRLYPALVGVAANGLQYGAFAQIRQNNGANGNAAGNTLYVRQVYSYIGLPRLGKIFAGQAGGALTQFVTGSLESIDVTGGFNGNTPFLQNSGTVLTWAVPDANGTYTTNKLVYISPKWGGLEVGASFEPYNATGATPCAQGGPSCPNLASTSGGADLRRNAYDVAAHYDHAFGPVAGVVEGGYWGSGVVNNSTGPQRYKGLDVFDGGIQATAYGFLVGLHYDIGTINSAYQPIYAGAHKMQAFTGGVQYTVGTLTGGVQLMDNISAGAYNPTARYQSGLHEMGFVLGGAWDYASGATAYASILYGQRHQSGIDLLNAVPGRYNNSTTARVFAVGNLFRW